MIRSSITAVIAGWLTALVFVLPLQAEVKMVKADRSFGGRDLVVWAPHENDVPLAGPSPLILVFPGLTRDITELQRLVCPTGLPGVGPISGDPYDPECLHHLAAARPSSIVVYVNGEWDGATGVTRSFDAGRCCGWARDNDVDDVGYVDSLLDWLLVEYAYDPQRVYAAGMSNGSMIAHRLGCELSSRISAIATVSGGIALESYFPACDGSGSEPCDDPPQFPATAFESCDPQGAVDVAIFHGSADKINPYNGGTAIATTEPYLISIDDTVQIWAEALGCTSGLEASTDAFPNVIDETTLDPAQPTDSSVTRIRYRCLAESSQATIWLYRVEGGGHAWPGGFYNQLLSQVTSRDVSASREMLGFFAGIVFSDDFESGDVSGWHRSSPAP